MCENLDARVFRQAIRSRSVPLCVPERLSVTSGQEALRVQQSDVAVEARKGRGDQIVAEIAAMPILDRRSTQEIIDDINEL